MSLLEFLKSKTAEEKELLATQLETKVTMLMHIAYGNRKPNIQVAIGLSSASQGCVKLEELRPDVDWADLRNGINSAFKSAA